MQMMADLIIQIIVNHGKPQQILTVHQEIISQRILWRKADECLSPHFKKGGCEMLSDREKFVLHLVATITIAKMTGIQNIDKIIVEMIKNVRRERCRSVAPEDVDDLLEEVNEEMQSGKLMFNHMMEDTIWSMTGERPNKNTNWDDMK